MVYIFIVICINPYMILMCLKINSVNKKSEHKCFHYVNYIYDLYKLDVSIKALAHCPTFKFHLIVKNNTSK